jgi:RimJ/RimL family protein N-acetyltransferase
MPRSLRTSDRHPGAGAARAGNPGALSSSRVILITDMGDLVTARLVLHPMTVSEAEQVVAGEPDSGARWAPGYPTHGDVFAARRFLETCANTGDPQPFGNYEIRCREDGQVIGGLGFHGPADENGSVTIGYGLIPSARGKGYASEALRGLLLFARTSGVTRVKGDTDHGNIASQHVMMAAGMRPAGEDERVRYFEIAWTSTTAITGPRS